MVVIELRFPTGRYHGTAWGRHVNEGVPEWPPSPFRLVRALYDVWRRKLPEWPTERAEPVLRLLASSAPVYLLPKTSASHTRSYLSQNERDAQKKRTLIFDAFVAFDAGERTFMGWPDAEPAPEVERDLASMLDRLNFLGRSESWVEACLGAPPDSDWNWRPTAAGSSQEDVERVAVAVPPGEYEPVAIGKGKKALSIAWMDALALGADMLHKYGLSHPPAMRFVEYAPAGPRNEPRRVLIERPTAVRSVCYALDSKVLPHVTEAIAAGEQMRKALMSLHEHPSACFSGKDADGVPATGHRHAFYLPYSSRADGPIDRILVRCASGFGDSELDALDRIEAIWRFERHPIRCVPVAWGGGLSAETAVESLTPFVPPRHFKGDTAQFPGWLEEQVRAECRNHGLPAPLRITLVRALWRGDRRELRWSEFRRNRKGDPVRPGFGLRLEFAEPVDAPFALGYGCHFGLGQFHATRRP